MLPHSSVFKGTALSMLWISVFTKGVRYEKGCNHEKGWDLQLGILITLRTLTLVS